MNNVQNSIEYKEILARKYYEYYYDEKYELYDIQEQLEASVVAAFQQIAQTSVELGIQIDFQAMVNPEWMSAVQSDFDPASELES